MHWESSTDTYILQCVKQLASGKLVYSIGSSVQCSVMIKGVGWGRWEGGPPQQGGDIYKHMANLIHVQQKLTHCKATVPPNKN